MNGPSRPVAEAQDAEFSEHRSDEPREEAVILESLTDEAEDVAEAERADDASERCGFCGDIDCSLHTTQ